MKQCDPDNPDDFHHDWRYISGVETDTINWRCKSCGVEKTVKKSRLHRKFEKAAEMNFVIVKHRGHWGHWGDCVGPDNQRWSVDKKTGEIKKDSSEYYKSVL